MRANELDFWIACLLADFHLCNGCLQPGNRSRIMLQVESTLLKNFKIHIAQGIFLTSYVENVGSAQTDICLHMCLLCENRTSDEVCVWRRN